MTIMFREYPALIHRDTDTQKPSDYGVSFIDFPGCVTTGRTLEEARTMAMEALQFHVEGLLEDGASIPHPTSLDDAEACAIELDARVVITVPVLVPSEVKRVNITLDSNLLREIDRFAEGTGESRSGFIASACRHRILQDRKLLHSSETVSRPL